MPLNINNLKVEKVIYNNKQVNFVKFKDEIILEDNYLDLGNYTGNPTLTPLNKEVIFNVNFISNGSEFKSIKITSSYVYYVNNDGEVEVYSYSNSSWTNLYKSIEIKNKVFVDSAVRDWFGINFIKN